ncbi:protein of unknown function [uncultured Woeseiaceae bacterium]|uniref:Uncharacterized protein n=1 Tax=uncultured Woeseiaceae bacterium TaxID=1983305 RepID=A0A7D9H4C8_9GAMM|nr:protein of unknown function [uncultured Woeseiaceae bacterium]
MIQLGKRLEPHGLIEPFPARRALTSETETTTYNFFYEKFSAWPTRFSIDDRISDGISCCLRWWRWHGSSAGRSAWAEFL